MATRSFGMPVYGQLLLGCGNQHITEEAHGRTSILTSWQMGRKTKKRKGLGLRSPLKGTLSIIRRLPTGPIFKVPSCHDDTELGSQPLTQVLGSRSRSKLQQCFCPKDKGLGISHQLLTPTGEGSLLWGCVHVNRGTIWDL